MVLKCTRIEVIILKSKKWKLKLLVDINLFEIKKKCVNDNLYYKAI